MQDFYRTAPTPLDQADGLRRLFAGRRQQVLALAANPHLPFGGLVLDRIATLLAAQGRQVLVVDSGAGAPQPHELAGIDLAAGIETIAERVRYLPARGLPLAHVDTRGSAAGFIDAVQRAAPDADVLLLHADAQDLARMFKRRAARPLLIGADHPESIKHAYAACKLLAKRCNLMTFDLLLVAPPGSPRASAIVNSLAGCADQFLGALLCDWALLDPAAEMHADSPALRRLLAAQLALGESAADAGLPAAAQQAPLPQAAAGAPTRPAFR